MKTVLAALTGFVLVIIVVNVDAQDVQLAYFDGNMLQQRLADEKDSIPCMMGMGYVLGVYDTTAGVLLCAPERVIPAQLVAIVQKYLAEHPQTLHLKAGDLVIDALSAAFPCRK